MNPDLDEQLREYAQRWRAGEPPLAAADLDRYTAPPQQRGIRVRSWLPVAASVAVILVIALAVAFWPGTGGHHGAVGSPSGSASPAQPVGRTVPWSSAGVTADDSLSYSGTTRPPVPAGTPACAVNDFVLVSSRTDPDPGMAGWLTTSFVLRSVRSTACQVAGRGPTVVIVDATGKPLPDDAVGLGGMVAPILVPPSALTSGQAAWAVYAGRVPQPARLLLSFSTQTSSAASIAISLAGVSIPPRPASPNSGAASVWRSAWSGSFVAVVQPGTLGSLVATVQAPAVVRAGAVLDYTVELRNPTDTAVSLAECPRFVEQLQGYDTAQHAKIPQVTGFAGPLNCVAAPVEIGPDTSVTFAFELDTRGALTSPTVNLVWQLGNELSATARLAVTS